MEATLSDFFQRTLDVMPEPALIVDSRGQTLYANAAARDAKINSVTHDFSPSIEQAIAAAAGGVPCELEGRRCDDAERTVLLMAYPLPNAHAAVFVRDVTERRRMAAMHTDFIANVSHELRTPLTAVIGIAETLLGPAQNDPEAYARFLPILQTQARRMTKLVSGLLGLTAGERRVFTPLTDRIDFLVLAREAIELLQFQARGRGMSIVDALGAEPMPVLGDADDLARVIQNLIENAIKYAHAHTSIVLERVRENTMIGIAVCDTSDGIAPELLPRITERFFRADSVRSTSGQSGVGLGLALVETIVRRHRGIFRPESTLNKGSRFTVLLPAHASP